MPVWGDGNLCPGIMFSISLGGKSCIDGHQFGMEEITDYIGFVYQFGVKGMHIRKHVQHQFDTEMDTHLGEKKLSEYKNGHQFGVEEIKEYIGFVCW